MRLPVLALTVFCGLFSTAQAFNVPDALGRLEAARDELDMAAKEQVRVALSGSLRPGDTSDAVPAMRTRLAQIYPGIDAAVPAHGADNVRYSDDLVTLVRRFQGDAGLKTDGVVGPQTLAHLNFSDADKVSVIEKNIARLQALQFPAGRYIVVNIPSFELTAYEDGREILRSKVIVGRPQTRTPLITSDLFSIKYNPDWTSPPGITKRYLAKLAAGDTQYFHDHKIMVIDANGVAVAPEDAAAGGRNFRFYQPPSAGSALGLLKFELDNRDNIYLHDTNERPLFSRDMRAHSSGCVRVERYEDLAAWVSGTDVEGIRAKISTGRTFWEKVQRVPVVITYLTALPDAEGVVIYPDIYRNDR
jgi:murein L,D-transpeptidase YcbB/YkuD